MLTWAVTWYGIRMKDGAVPLFWFASMPLDAVMVIVIVAAFGAFK